MANYTSDLKTWGSTGQEPPDNYNYVEGEQPVDAWDNWLNSNVITDVQHLITLTNDRLESDKGTSHPASPEVGHISHREDTANLPNGSEATFVYDTTNAEWRRLMKADGDSLTGDLDVGGFSLTDSSSTHVSIATEASVAGATLDTEWMSKQEGGTVDAGSLVPVGTFGLADGETLEITQSMLMRDGVSTACVSGVDLIITDGSSSLQTVLSGDGTTVYDDETTGWSYTNSSGGHQTIAIALDNGHFNAGYGQAVSAYAGFVARVV